MLALLRRAPLSRVIQGWNLRHVFRMYPAKERAREEEIESADRAVERFLANKRIIEAIAAAHGVPAVFVWQPVPTYGYDLRHHVTRDFGRHALSGVGYERMRVRLEDGSVGDRFVWCADLQQGLHELLYVDMVHYSPAMSERVARCIAQGIVDLGLMRAGPGVDGGRRDGGRTAR